MAEAFIEARDIPARRRGDLDKGTELLLAKEAIAADDLPPIQRGGPAHTPRLAPARSA